MAVDWLLVGGIAWLVGRSAQKRRCAILSEIARLEREVQRIENKPSTGWFGIDEKERGKRLRKLEREIALLTALL